MPASTEEAPHVSAENAGSDGAAGLRERGHHLEELQQAPAGDLVAIDLFVGQVVGMQQSRDEAPQLLFKLWGHI